jgi:ubiquinone/menaquinone biosynthesis C-methylase UbiE
MSSDVLRGGEKGAERLRLLARVAWPKTRGLLRRVDVARGMRCLDVGCGIGQVTRRLARRVGPSGRAVGIDSDEAVLGLARQEAALRGVPAVFRAASVLELDEPAENDLVYARFLLGHLVRPEDGLRRLAAAARPGGCVAVEDVDFGGAFCFPACPAFDRYITWYQAASRQRGGDPTIGPRLPNLLEDAGLAGVRVRVLQPAYRRGEGKQLVRVTMEHVREAVCAAGLATAAEIDATLAELDVAIADPRILMGWPRIFQAWGRKT